MPQYLAPGVYVEEVPSGIKPIAGVGTSTAGFVGAVADDVTMPALPGTAGSYAQLVPEHQARLITSWEAFVQAFGDMQAGNHGLAHAVYGFFNNGGSRCWVTRVAAPEPPGDHVALPDIDSVAASSVMAALNTFTAIDEIAIVAVPGATSDAVQNAVLDHCENPHLQDRFAVLDGRRTDTATAEAIQGGTRDSSYGAIYHPWIRVYDPVSNDLLTVPPSGHVAGVYARVDTERGVHKAPANEVIRGALDVATPVSREDQAGLNPHDVNVIRKFGGNVTVFGARTLGGEQDPEWRYVPVRRLFLFLRDSINAGVQWTVFEPNDMALWGKLRRNLSAFLTNVWRSGALVGATPDEAFFVRCDATVNTPETQALGQVVAEIGVAVVRPAEFVIFRISQWAGPTAGRMSRPTTVLPAPLGVPGIARVDVPPGRSVDQPSGVCAFLGVAGSGPLYTPVAVQRADEWTTTFGPVVPGAHLGPAVQGFFACGGTACHVVRVDLGDDDWLARGLAALDPLEDADLVAVPDLPASPADRRVALQRQVLEHCARTGTRFAVLDSAPGAGAAAAIADRAGLDSRFGALYFPWVRLGDGSVVPPCGHVAGGYAAADADRGVGSAPANRELAGVLDLVPAPTAAELADLIAAGVNPLRSLPGRGLRVWGARTLAGADQPEWTAIGVSRLFLAVARWLAATGPALAFEPDDLALWVRVRRQLTERLWQLWRQGSLAGATPDEAFYVTCDAGTNPPASRDAGLLITEIGLAPTVPAEFVVVRLVQQGADVSMH